MTSADTIAISTVIRHCLKLAELTPIDAEPDKHGAAVAFIATIRHDSKKLGVAIKGVEISGRDLIFTLVCGWTYHGVLRNVCKVVDRAKGSTELDDLARKHILKAPICTLFVILQDVSHPLTRTFKITEPMLQHIVLHDARYSGDSGRLYTSFIYKDVMYGGVTFDITESPCTAIGNWLGSWISWRAPMAEPKSVEERMFESYKDQKDARGITVRGQRYLLIDLLGGRMSTMARLETMFFDGHDVTNVKRYLGILIHVEDDCEKYVAQILKFLENRDGPGRVLAFLQSYTVQIVGDATAAKMEVCRKLRAACEARVQEADMI